jgi:hypothetical protein
LLGNSDINNWSNYFFSPTPEDPFHLNLFSDWEHSSFNDIETSIWYERTHKLVITEETNDILVPICLFIDSTVLSQSGSLSLEPVLFSLMIHNRETRKRSDAWLPLGYIHDPTSIPGKKYRSTEERYADYHFMLSVILEGLIELVDERNQGFDWCFKKVPGTHKKQSRRLHFRLAFIIGDTKGHDILCGRMGSHNLTPGLCRDCDMRTEFADNPGIPCFFLKQKELRQKNDGELKEMSFYRIPFFTFDALDFGASPYGINCATAIDIIHGILIGMMEYLYTTFTDQLTGSQMKELSNTVAFIATFCSRGIPGFVECHRFRKGLCHFKGIMTAKTKLSRCFLVFMAMRTRTFYVFLKDQPGKLPSAIQRYIRKKRNNAVSYKGADDGSENSRVQQPSNSDDSSSNSDSDNEEDDSVCSSNVFSASPCASSSDSKSCSSYSTSSDIINDHSLEGLSIDYNSSNDDSTYNPHEDLDDKDPVIFTEDVYLSWRNLFENMLLFYGWLTNDNMPCKDFRYGSGSVAKYCCQKFMEQYKEVAYRFEGMGLKLTKFHQIRHWYFYVSMYGVPSNFDSSFCESHHIYLSKKAGRRTQKRQDDLARQTAERVYEANLLSIACRTSQKNINSKRQQKTHHRRNRKILRGAKYRISFDYSGIDDEAVEGSTHLVNRGRGNLNVLFNYTPKVKFSWCQKRNQDKRPFPDLIISSLVKKLAWFNNGCISQRIVSIDGYTELRLHSKSASPTKDKVRNIIRSHPDYRGKGIWFDWVGVTWEVENDDDESSTFTTTLPAQVVMILDFGSATFEPIPEPIMVMFPILSQGSRELMHQCRDGVQLLIHSASEDHNERNVDAAHSIARRYSMEPFFQLIHLQNVAGHVFVARDPSHTNNPNDMEFDITCIVHRTQWGTFFIPHLRGGYEPPDEHSYFLDEFNVDYNPW